MTAPARLPFPFTCLTAALFALGMGGALTTAAASDTALAHAPDAAATVLDPMADLSIEELANIQVTSVSRKPESLAAAAASIFVITADDIRRSGADSLADALRIAPNLHVGQNNNAGYAISARGLNGSNTSAPNKLLVIIDGRSVYAPLFSGVFWDAQDVVMQDIERIEVISGPGGTLWGVNAVNGVINIITRHARDTAGSLAVLNAGSRGGDLAFRQGGRTGDIDWRVYGKYLQLGHSELADGGRVNDALKKSQVGFRADWSRGADTVSVHGDAYRGANDQAEPGLVSVGSALALGRVDTVGVNLTGRWQHALDGGGDISVQAYLDRTLRTVPPTFREALTLLDVQLLHHLAPVGAHSIAWGANYRRSRDTVDNSDFIAFLPARGGQTWASLFAQDEVEFGQAWHATLGLRAERNDYTGTELLPTARLTWAVAPAHTLWGGWSRTVRAPSRLDADAYIPSRPPFLLGGGPAVRSEVARVIELGYRGQPLPNLSYSVTAFHNRYDHLRTLEVEPGGTFYVFGNQMHGTSHGIEMWGKYQASAGWRLSAGFMALHETLVLNEGSIDVGGPGTAGKDPAHTLQLRSSFDLAANQELEIGLRKVAGLSNPQVPGYVALDARLEWRMRPGLTLAVSGRNLNGGHGEYDDVMYRMDVPRSVALQLVWRQ